MNYRQLYRSLQNLLKYDLFVSVLWEKAKTFPILRMY